MIGVNSTDAVANSVGRVQGERQAGILQAIARIAKTRHSTQNPAPVPRKPPILKNKESSSLSDQKPLLNERLGGQIDVTANGILRAPAHRINILV